MTAYRNFKDKIIQYGSFSDYCVLGDIGSGAFADVVRCRDTRTNKEVAAKLIRDYVDRRDIERELFILEEIRTKCPESRNLVKFFEPCLNDGETCLIFELLEMSLSDINEANDQKGLSLQMIRPIAKQLFLALEELKHLQILHADIKPNNVMIADIQEMPYRVKLIDFGLAIKHKHVKPGMKIQQSKYRAPEVYLGLPITEAIDVWGVGCILAYLCLGCNLFSVSKDQVPWRIFELLGQPADHLLHAGKYTDKYFIEDEAADGSSCWITKPRECSEVNNKTPSVNTNNLHHLSSLEDLLHINQNIEEAEYDDMLAFVDLLHKLLHVDWNQRISAHSALEHPFIKMEHLSKPHSQHYLCTAQTLMEECPMSSTKSSSGSFVTGSPEGVPVTYTYFDEELPNIFSSDGGLRQCSSHADLAARSSEGAKPKDATSDVSASSGRPRKLFQRIRKFFCRVKNSDGDSPSISALFYSNGQIPPVSDEEHPNVFSSDGEPRQCSNDADLTARSSEGAKPKDATSDVSASSGRPRKLFQRIRKFFCQVMNSDGDSPPISAAFYSNGQIPPVSDEEHPNVFSSDGEPRQCSNDADLAASSSEGVKPKDASPDVSASSGRPRKLFQRFRKFFGRVKNSDGERPPISAALYTNGQIPPVSNEGHPNVFSSCRRTLFQWICKLFRPVKNCLFWICFLIVLLIFLFCILQVALSSYV